MKGRKREHDWVGHFVSCRRELESGLGVCACACVCVYRGIPKSESPWTYSLLLYWHSKAAISVLTWAVPLLLIGLPVPASLLIVCVCVVICVWERECVRVWTSPHLGTNFGLKTVDKSQQIYLCTQFISSRIRGQGHLFIITQHKVVSQFAVSTCYKHYNKYNIFEFASGGNVKSSNKILMKHMVLSSQGWHHLLSSKTQSACWMLDPGCWWSSSR